MHIVIMNNMQWYDNECDHNREEQKKEHTHNEFQAVQAIIEDHIIQREDILIPLIYQTQAQINGSLSHNDNDATKRLCDCCDCQNNIGRTACLRTMWAHVFL